MGKKNKTKKDWGLAERYDSRHTLAFFSIIIITILLLIIQVVVLKYGKEDFVGALPVMLPLVGKWFLIAILPLVIIFTIYLLFKKTSYVVFEEGKCTKYKSIFAKEGQEILFKDIKKCVICQDEWVLTCNNIRKTQRIYLMLNGVDYYSFDLSKKLMFLFYKYFDYEKVFVLSVKHSKPTTIDEYYHLDFQKLTDEEKKVLIKSHCNLIAPKKWRDDGPKLIAKAKKWHPGRFKREQERLEQIKNNEVDIN